MNTEQEIAYIFGKKPVSVNTEPIQHHNGISSRIAARDAGVKRYHAVFQDGSTICFVGKRKSVRVIANGIRMICGSDPLQTMKLTFRHKIFGYNGSVTREARLYSQPGTLPKTLIPHFLGSAADLLCGSCMIAMEELPASEPAAPSLFRILEQIAQLHAQYYGKTTLVKDLGLNHYSVADYRKTGGILRQMFEKLDAENRAVFSAAQIAEIRRFLSEIDREFAALSYRRTLTHNDCCDRNLCIAGDRICLYDWELACWQNPEHDAVELIISVMDKMPDETVLEALHTYRRRIEALTGVPMTDAEYGRLLRFNTLEYCVNKLAILRYAGKTLHDSTPDRLAHNTARMLHLLGI